MERWLRGPLQAEPSRVEYAAGSISSCKARVLEPYLRRVPAGVVDDRERFGRDSPRQVFRERRPGTPALMDSENEDTVDNVGTPLAIPRSVQRAAGDVIHQAFERLLSSELHVTTAAEGKHLLAEDDDTEQMTDAMQRFVGIATPVMKIALRGARFTRIPWVLVASSSVSIGVTVRSGVRELQVLAALLAHRFEDETGAQPDAALLQKLTLELYLRPRRTPNVAGRSLPLARLARRWIVSGALGRNTRRQIHKALDAAERLDITAFAGAPRVPPGRG
jgi:hypothetical protein